MLGTGVIDYVVGVGEVDQVDGDPLWPILWLTGNLLWKIFLWFGSSLALGKALIAYIKEAEEMDG